MQKWLRRIRGAVGMGLTWGAVGGLMLSLFPAALVPVALVWGFFVIANSAQFSVLVTESVPPVVRVIGWALAFPMLALGPMAGIWSIRALSNARRTPGNRAS